MAGKVPLVRGERPAGGAQWDTRGPFADAAPGHTLYHPDGQLRGPHLATLKALAADADRLGMVVQLVLLSRESWLENSRLEGAAADRAVGAVAREMLSHRNVVFQVWNEFADRVPDHVRTVKSVDPKRLVTNSPGVAGVLGEPAHNRALDFLTPHTSRQQHAPAGRHWEVAPREVAYLLSRYGKPVVDDEPARGGTAASEKFGGPAGDTSPFDDVLHIRGVWQAGGHVTYHHDLFQAGYGAASVPPHGVPDPEFSPYHRTVFEFLRQRGRYLPAGR